jgi:4-amino-4-deoxy-L-arabinose transferase-like glycosyltransferase
MNYVDVARNISEGRGIKQSSLGFNQKQFSIEQDIPVPFVSQPPLYPITIAVISFFGISHSDGALLVSVISYALLLGIVFLLTKALFDKYVALLSVGLLLFYYPLRLVASYACSEPLGLVFVFGSFLVLIHACDASEKSRRWGWTWLSGLLAGLAFSCRYALISTVLTGIVFTVLTFRNRVKKNLLDYILGFLVPFLAVVGHNFLVSGFIVQQPNPSESGLRRNLADAFWSLFGKTLHLFDHKVEAGLLFSLIFVMALILLIRKKLTSEIKSVLFSGKRIILILWPCLYLSLLIIQRTRFHFDPITPRFMVFVGVPMVVVLCAFVSSVVRWKPLWVILGTVLISVFAFGKELTATIRTPDYDLRQVIRGSERLNWVNENTAAKDLIIGDDAVDIVFYLNRPAVISFSPYPYTDYVDYDRITGYAQKHRDRYSRFFVVLRKRFRTQETIQKRYGPFVSDLFLKRIDTYPGLNLIEELNNGLVYEIQPSQESES